MKTPQLLCIVWDDIVTDSGWADESSTEPATCVSVGFLRYNTPTTYVLAATVGDDSDGKREYNSRIIIPKGVVRSCREIKHKIRTER